MTTRSTTTAIALAIAMRATPASAQDWPTLERTAADVMRATKTPGLQVAVVRGDSVVLVRAFGIDIALVVHPQGELRQVLRGVAPDLLATLLAVEPAVVARTVQGFVGGVVTHVETLVRTEHRIGHDIAVRTCAALDGAAP